MSARIVVLELVSLQTTRNAHPAAAPAASEDDDPTDAETPNLAPVTFACLVPNGEWHLLLNDDAAMGAGNLAGQTIVVTAKVKG